MHKVHVVGWVIAARDSGLALLHKEASLMDDADVDVNYVMIRNGMLGKVGKRCSPEQARNKKEFKPL